jgi:hypothetical protein
VILQIGEIAGVKRLVIELCLLKLADERRIVGGGGRSWQSGMLFLLLTDKR